MRLNGLYGLILEVEEYIEKVNDSDGKRILRKRYLEGKTVRIIAVEMHHSEKTIRRKHAMTVYNLEI